MVRELLRMSSSCIVSLDSSPHPYPAPSCVLILPPSPIVSPAHEIKSITADLTWCLADGARCEEM